MGGYINRKLEKIIRKYLGIFPVVGIVGPRQSGKSTMLLESFRKEFRYVSMDDFRTASVFYNDPERFMNIYSEGVIFDEAHKTPELFSHIKNLVDKKREKYGRFIITGSAQFSLSKKISESLAGRIGLLSLLPFQHSEIPKRFLSESIFKGSYPELVKRNYESWREWFSSYVETYINKDLRDFAQIGDIQDFRRFILLLAANCAQMLNMSSYSKDLGVSVPTIKRWTSILEASFIIFLLPPYYKNFGKRMVKSPKLYFYDTGLISFLTGIETESMFENGPLSGAIFENYVVSEIRKKLLHENIPSDLYFLRTNHGVEIDLMVDKRSSIDLIEIKKSMTFKPEMVKNFETLSRVDGNRFLLYRGDEFEYMPNLKIMNYAKYLS